MDVCFLYGNPKALLLADWLKSEGHRVILYDKPLSSLRILGECFDCVISFTYRYHIPNQIVNEVGGCAINLHISFLPWNRGADPNIWSWIDDTPKGVSIHYVSEKIDSGDIIAQKITPMNSDETLESSYEKLMNDAFILFKEILPYYAHWNKMRKKTCGEGSFHRISQLDPFRSSINYQLPISELNLPNIVKGE